jgi:hypothetical protein
MLFFWKEEASAMFVEFLNLFPSAGLGLIDKFYPANAAGS